jgi:endonuclease/exonuclease/phosphatase family metal-dependent hydrolase
MDRLLWQDHNTYLTHLTELLASRRTPLIIAGDLNQRLPQKRQPIDSYQLLVTALQHLTIHTKDTTDPALIDHIATTNDFEMQTRQVIHRQYDGNALSDHDGVTVTLTWKVG